MSERTILTPEQVAPLRHEAEQCEGSERVVVVTPDFTLSLCDTIEAQAEVIRGVLTCCRECRDEMPPFAEDVPPADFIVWGKLAEPEALGPKCYDHAVKHLGSAMPGRADQYAVVDLRPLRAVLRGEASGA